MSLGLNWIRLSELSSAGVSEEVIASALELPVWTVHEHLEAARLSARQLEFPAAFDPECSRILVGCERMNHG
jgi:hypothetical protein